MKGNQMEAKQNPSVVSFLKKIKNSNHGFSATAVGNAAMLPINIGLPLPSRVFDQIT